ncbi:uncharacterized protein LOC144352763 [Saccoglossus kowalevskii]
MARAMGKAWYRRDTEEHLSLLEAPGIDNSVNSGLFILENDISMLRYTEPWPQWTTSGVCHNPYTNRSVTDCDVNAVYDINSMQKPYRVNTTKKTIQKDIDPNHDCEYKINYYRTAV